MKKKVIKKIETKDRKEKRNPKVMEIKDFIVHILQVVPYIRFYNRRSLNNGCI